MQIRLKYFFNELISMEECTAVMRDDRNDSGRVIFECISGTYEGLIVLPPKPMPKPQDKHTHFKVTFELATSKKTGKLYGKLISYEPDHDFITIPQHISYRISQDSLIVNVKTIEKCKYCDVVNEEATNYDVEFEVPLDDIIEIDGEVYYIIPSYMPMKASRSNLDPSVVPEKYTRLKTNIIVPLTISEDTLNALRELDNAYEKIRDSFDIKSLIEKEKIVDRQLQLVREDLERRGIKYEIVKDKTQVVVKVDRNKMTFEPRDMPMLSDKYDCKILELNGELVFRCTDTEWKIVYPLEPLDHNSALRDHDYFVLYKTISQHFAVTIYYAPYHKFDHIYPKVVTSSDGHSILVRKEIGKCQECGLTIQYHHEKDIEEVNVFSINGKVYYFYTKKTNLFLETTDIVGDVSLDESYIEFPSGLRAPTSVSVETLKALLDAEVRTDDEEEVFKEQAKVLFSELKRLGYMLEYDMKKGKCVIVSPDRKKGSYMRDDEESFDIYDGPLAPLCESCFNARKYIRDIIDFHLTSSLP